MRNFGTEDKVYDYERGFNSTYILNDLNPLQGISGA
jgi:hypothetical protein